MMEVNIEQFSFKLKEEGFRKMLNDSAEIIGKSIFLIEEENLKSFYKVIATQLRILLCEGDDSLILKGGKIPLLAPLTDNYLVKDDFCKMADFRALFNHDGEHLKLEDWIKQVVMVINHPILLPKKIKCSKCGNEIDVEKEHNNMFLSVTNKVIIRHKCVCSNTYIRTDVTKELEKEENTFTVRETIEHTIEDIIKSYANKNGGAHVEKNIRFNRFADVVLGERYLLAIANYILGVITYKAKSAN
jgi:hypothetical protein